ncbi:MAG: hypothetical protein H6Q89_126 [Myxococcaceae bacterium]|nr:hypothetical protein [Myxococcaceae bacterium]
MPYRQMGRSPRASLGPDRQRALLVRLARVGTSSQPLPRVVKQLLQQVVESFELHTAHMHLIDGEQLVYVGSAGCDGSPVVMAKIHRLPIDDLVVLGAGAALVLIGLVVTISACV